MEPGEGSGSREWKWKHGKKIEAGKGSGSIEERWKQDKEEEKKQMSRGEEADQDKGRIRAGLGFYCQGRGKKLIRTDL